jgi:hypothetical protein
VKATVIIGCGKAKRALEDGESVPIETLYTGSLYRARLAYAERLGGPHYVLSAAHGLVPAGEEVASYEVDLRGFRMRERGAWADRVLGQFTHFVSREYPVVLLAAGPYLDWIGSARGVGYDVRVPAQGLPIGRAIAWFREAAQGGDHASDARRVAGELARVGTDAVSDDEEYLLTAGVLRALLTLEARS